MRLFKLCTIVLICLLTYSCSDNGEEGGAGDPLPDSFFSNLGENHETPRAYLVYSSVLQYDQETMTDVLKYRDRVALIFTNGSIATDDDGTIVFSENTTQMASLSLRDLNDGQVQDDVNSVNLATQTYTLSPGTTVAINGSVDVNYTEGVTNYGELNGYYLPLADDDTATIEITNLTIDIENMSGYLEATYRIEPGIDGAIIGTHVGSFDIIK